MDRRKITAAVWDVLAHILPSKWFISLKYWVIYHKWINWKDPKAFTEKLQWMKLYAFRPEYVEMVDKVKVKEYIRKKLGDEYVIPLLGVWKSEKDIDFDTLPDRFALKCNHDSGTIVVCSDKSALDKEKTRKILGKALRTNYYLTGREKPYKYVERRIFAEQFLQNEGINELLDYKFFCFDGVPRITKIDYGRAVAHHANYYDMDMNLLPFGVVTSHPTDRVFTKPDNFGEMVDIAKKLSAGIPFVRVDLYDVGGKIYFGELTFYPTSGFNPFTDYNWDLRLGEWLKLPPKNK